jgi:hypothetical protein
MNPADRAKEQAERLQKAREWLRNARGEALDKLRPEVERLNESGAPQTRRFVRRMREQLELLR